MTLLIALAVSLLPQDGLQDRLEVLTAKIRENPRDPALYVERAKTYSTLSRNDEAMRDCSRALELNPRSEDAYVQRGRVQCALNEAEGAIADFTRAVELNPGVAMTWLHRARAWVLKESPGNAKRDLERALAIDPSLAAAAKRAMAGEDPEAPPARKENFEQRLATVMKTLEKIEGFMASGGEAEIPALERLKKERPEYEKLLDRALARIAAAKKRAEEIAGTLGSDDLVEREAAQEDHVTLGAPAIATIRRLAGQADGDAKAHLQEALRRMEAGHEK